MLHMYSDEAICQVVMIIKEVDSECIAGSLEAMLHEGGW